MTSPKEQGYFFPAEWHPHRATWLSWPHKEESWPGKLENIYTPYSQFIKEVSAGEQVRINVMDASMENLANTHLVKMGVDLTKVTFYHHPTNDAWCRDHGPAFLINKEKGKPPMIVDWGYNAWGNKYPPYNLDDNIPSLIAKQFNVAIAHPGIVMEGGSVDFNGKGSLLTTKACLLNPNRNPQLSQHDIEDYLYRFYGVEQILWLEDGIVGDDTDGHIDDITRFVDSDTIVTAIEENQQDENYAILQKNLKLLKKMRLINNKPLTIIELPMPKPVIFQNQRLPASYANFYISNAAVVVPTYRDINDQKALDILSKCFPERKVIGIDSTDIIWGLGSWHCLSQQEPLGLEKAAERSQGFQ